MKTLLKTGIAFALFAVACAAPGAASASTDLYVGTTIASSTADMGTSDNPYPTIEAGVAAATSTDTVIHLAAETFTPATAITIPVASLKIQGAGVGSTFINISAAAGNALFNVGPVASGFTLENVEIVKTDSDLLGEVGVVRINANDVTIRNNSFHGTFAYPADNGAPASRAMVISGGLTGLTIDGNTVYSMRQPAYISGPTEGTASNNVVYGTKGWVLEGGNVVFTNNSWGGSSAAKNVVDFAILSTAGSAYPDINAMAAANGNAVIEDQRTSPRVLSHVYVDASVVLTGEHRALHTKLSLKHLLE